MPAISVIIPVYNAEKHLHMCLKSLKSQTFKDYEVIIIDDGSTDNSFNICEKYAKHDDRLTLVRQENNGVGAVRKKGLEYIKGKYLLQIDSDDWLESSMLEDMYSIALRDNSDIVICDYKKIFNDGSIENYSHNNICSKEELIIGLLKHKINGALWNKLFKVEVIFSNLISFEKDINMWEDFLFTLRYLNNCNKVSFLNKSLYYYRVNDSGLVKTYNSIKKIHNQMYVSSEVEKLNYIYSNFSQYFIYSRFYSIINLINIGNLYDPKLWKRYNTLNTLDVLKSEISYRHKILFFLASKNLFFILYLIQKLGKNMKKRYSFKVFYV